MTSIIKRSLVVDDTKRKGMRKTAAIPTNPTQDPGKLDRFRLSTGDTN